MPGFQSPGRAFTVSGPFKWVPWGQAHTEGGVPLKTLVRLLAAPYPDSSSSELAGVAFLGLCSSWDETGTPQGHPQRGLVCFEVASSTDEINPRKAPLLAPGKPGALGALASVQKWGVPSQIEPERPGLQCR